MEKGGLNALFLLVMVSADAAAVAFVVGAVVAVRGGGGSLAAEACVRGSGAPVTFLVLPRVHEGISLLGDRGPGRVRARAVRDSSRGSALRPQARRRRRIRKIDEERDGNKEVKKGNEKRY